MLALNSHGMTNPLSCASSLGHFLAHSIITREQVFLTILSSFLEEKQYECVSIYIHTKVLTKLVAEVEGLDSFL